MLRVLRAVRSMPRWLQVAALVLLAAYFGVAGSFWQAAVLRLGPVPVPYGVLAALALTLAVLVAACLAAGNRVGGVLALLAWVLPVFALGVARAEGDKVLVADKNQALLTALSYSWAYGGVLLAAAALAVSVPLWRRWLRLDWPEAGAPNQGHG